MRNFGRSEIGKMGEDLAVRHLKSKGYRILERNYRTKFGEIDIIAISPKNELVLVEVKTMKKGEIKPEDNITTKKMKNFRRVAEAYFNSNSKWSDCRLDVIAISVETNGGYEINHYENV